jgi:Xaa-Pro aminopeptidase
VPSREEWADEIARRRLAFRRVVDENGCDAALVFSAQGHNQTFRYLTNFTPVLGDMWAVVGPSDPIDCVVNFAWELDAARALPPGDRGTGGFDAVPAVAAAVAEARPARVGVDGFDRIPLRAVEAIRAQAPDVELVDIGSPVAALRRRKSPLEISLLREAARIADAAFDSIRAGLREGQSEHEIAASLGVVVQGHGAAWAFPPCVQADFEQPVIIRMPSEKRVSAQDSVMLDIGPEWDGYQADAARTYVIGEPNELQQRAWDAVRRAHEAALAVTRPGTPCRDVDRAARDVIEGAGFTLRHRIGHGIGLATSFEWPSMDTETAPLEPGMVVCIEPSVVEPGAGTMKIEDDVLLTDDGFELLTRSPITLSVG